MVRAVVIQPNLLRRADRAGRPSMSHFLARVDGPTLCGVTLLDPRPSDSVHCPRCLALVAPGSLVEEDALSAKGS